MQHGHMLGETTECTLTLASYRAAGHPARRLSLQIWVQASQATTFGKRVCVCAYHLEGVCVCVCADRLSGRNIGFLELGEFLAS